MMYHQAPDAHPSIRTLAFCKAGPKRGVEIGNAREHRAKTRSNATSAGVAEHIGVGKVALR